MHLVKRPNLRAATFEDWPGNSEATKSVRIQRLLQIHTFPPEFDGWIWSIFFSPQTKQILILETTADKVEVQ